MAVDTQFKDALDFGHNLLWKMDSAVITHIKTVDAYLLVTAAGLVLAQKVTI